ncbi:ERF family protein [Carnobacterium maltaromaticum]|uniref:ERF family protein n=1 Tax=Carnobacterium maltaromaticum TaxID=2751 RepID=UPI0039B0B160
MKKSESIAEITKAMVNVQKQLKPLEKSANNPFTESKYTPLDVISKTILELTPEQGIAVFQEPVSTERNSVGVATLLSHVSGEWIEFEPFDMEIVSNKKMSSAQEAGSTITYTKRYTLAAIFGIVSDEDKDGNASKPNQTNNNGSTGKISPKQIGLVKNLFNQYATLTKSDVLEVSKFVLERNKITNLENANSSQASALIKYMQVQISKKQDDGQ